MPITILRPQPAQPPVPESDFDFDSDSEGGVDVQGDISMRASKRIRTSQADDILTPGSLITSNPQFMR